MRAKYTIGSLAFICTAIAASCTDNELVNQNREIVMTGSDFQYASQSRTAVEITPEKVHFKWASKDTVGIFPDKGGQVYFPITNGEGTNKATFSGGGWALKPSSQYVAYYPLVGQFYLDKTTIPVSFEGQEQTGNASTDHVGKCDYMAAVATNPTGNNVAFNFEHLGCLVELKITVPKKGSVDNVTLSADEELFTTKGTVDLTAEQPTIKAIRKSTSQTIRIKDVTTTTDNEVVKVYFMMAPVFFGGKQIKVDFNNGGTIIRTMISPVDMIPGKAYSYSIVSEGQQPNLNSIHVATAGTLPQLVGEANRLNIDKLKITGYLNGTDLFFLKEMTGNDSLPNPRKGKLKVLNMYDAHIVEGGEPSSSQNEIYRRAFRGCTTLEKIIFPKDLQKIRNDAFESCTGLTDITFSEGLTDIENDAFRDCINLTSISFPSTLKNLNGFRYCTGLIDLKIPEGITSIHNNAFNYCSGLLSIKLPSSLTSVDGFRGCDGIISIELPEGITTINPYAFSNCTGLQKVKLPSTLTTLDGFDYCTSLTNITIPQGVTTLGDGVFNGCTQLNNVVVPEGVTVIGMSSFSNCDNLTNITLPSTLKGLGGFNYCKNLEQIDIPYGVDSISVAAFFYCNKIKELIIPKSVTKIGANAFSSCYTIDKLDIQAQISILHESRLESSNIKKLSLPASLKQIRANNFSSNYYIQEMYCNAVVPPYVYPNSLNPECTIYVPKGSLDAYKTAHWWKDYASQIVEIPSDFSKTTTIHCNSNSYFITDQEGYILNYDGNRIEIDHDDFPLLLSNPSDKDKIQPADKIFLKDSDRYCDIYRDNKIVGSVQIIMQAYLIHDIVIGGVKGASMFPKYKGKKVIDLIKWSDTRNPHRHCPIVSPQGLDLRKLTFWFDITNNNEANDPIIAEMLMLYNKYLKPATESPKTITFVNLENN